MERSKTLFLRGARLQQFIVEDSTFNQLIQNIEQNFDTTKRQNATQEAHVQSVVFTPDTGKGILVVNSKVRGTSGTYSPHIEFLNVQFGQGTGQITKPDGSVVNLVPIDLNTTNVRVACTCMDFYFRFSLWNVNDDSHYGPAPAPYQRKTTTRPPVNPSRVPGVCKHIIKTVENLQQSGIAR